MRRESVLFRTEESFSSRSLHLRARAPTSLSRPHRARRLALALSRAHRPRAGHARKHTAETPPKKKTHTSAMAGRGTLQSVLDKFRKQEDMNAAVNRKASEAWARVSVCGGGGRDGEGDAALARAWTLTPPPHLSTHRKKP